MLNLREDLTSQTLTEMEERFQGQNHVPRNGHDGGNYPAVVIGGGLAGLVAATLLARAGKQVRLFEKSRSLGGRSQSQTKEGFIYNQGPHALYRAGHGLQLLERMGIPVSGSIPSGAGSAIYRGEAYALPGAPKTIATTRLLSWREKWEYARFMLGIAKLDPETVAGLTVQEWIEESVTSPKVRQTVLMYVRLTTYANAPEIQSASAAVRQLQRAVAANVLYLDGGWQQLVDGVRKAALDAGVEIQTQQRVVALLNHGRTTTRVRLDDESEFSAQIVIAAVDPQTVRELLVDGDNDVLDAWLPAGPAIRAAVLDIALRRLPRPETTLALGVDEPLYLSIHSAIAQLAPEGGALIHLAKYLPNETADTAAEDSGQIERQLEEVLDLVQPGWRAELVHQRLLPNMIVAHTVDRQDGMRGSGNGRSSHRVPGYNNVYVAGDWVQSDEMLVDAALESAEVAAEMASAHAEMGYEEIVVNEKVYA